MLANICIRLKMFMQFVQFCAYEGMKFSRFRIAC